MEKLIEEVKKYPVLYDQRNEKYRNAEYKERVWTLIATHLEIKGGGEECKKKWASVRDQFRRTLQRRRTVSGQAAVTLRKYKYEDVLQFLLPHVAERETISNVTDSEEVANNEVSADDTLEEEEVIDGDEPESVQEYIQEEPEILGQKTQEEVLSVNSSAKNPKFIKPVLKRKLQQRQSKPPETASSQLMTYILSEKKTQKQSEVASVEAEKHPVDAFLAGIVAPLKFLSPILLNEAKGRIFSIVQECEMKQLLASQETIRSFPCNQFAPLPASSPAFAPSPASSGSVHSVPTPYASPVYWNLDNASQLSGHHTDQTQNLE
ncbi:unnamed protein product [Ceutorhynchus assimilis]|uniref:MADF domain-containing protein n=1 Tax=Ceutorhynchus assimilis TaxID=467358 RepID=A0A9N9QNW1_9CUCU|nr:unnamed protein product [Ceutorhynchus assimilis]